MQQDWIEIGIVNWEKYNPRSDRASSTWFRLQNTIASEPKFFGLTPSQKYVAICLFAEASKCGGATARIHVSWLAHHLEVKRADVLAVISHLEASGVLLLHPDTAALPLVSEPLPPVSTGISTYVTNDTNDTNDTNERNTAEPPPPTAAELESLYLKYPLKKGKADGLARVKACVRTREDFEALSQAIDRYTADLKANGTAPKYVKHFSSFIGTKERQPWRDWIEPDAGQANLPAVNSAPLNRAEVVSQANRSMAERVMRGEL